MCEVEPAVGAASVPGVPMSVAWGKRCLEHGAIGPLWVVNSQVGLNTHPDRPSWDDFAPWFREGTTYKDGAYVRVDTLELETRECEVCNGDGCPGCFEGRVASIVGAMTSKT